MAIAKTTRTTKPAASATPAKAPVARKPAAAPRTPAARKPATAKIPVIKKALATPVKSAIKPVAKPEKNLPKPAPAAKAKAAKPAKIAKPATPEVKVKKVKQVRDSFTMPETEYNAIADVKRACLKAGFEIRKSDLLRIGIQLIKGLDTAKLQELRNQLTPLKAGRPRK